MSRVTDDTSFPFISFSKSIIKSIYERNKMNQMNLLITYTEYYGKPKTIRISTPNNQIPPEIFNLQISPCGDYNETVQEGLIQFNNLKFLNQIPSPFFLAKKPEMYSVIFLSDGSSLSSDFYKFQANNEWLIRADENFYFCQVFRSLSQSKEFEQIFKNEFSEALKQIDFDVIQFCTTYAGTFTLIQKLFSNIIFFNYLLNFGQTIVRAKSPIKLPMIWPFPYDTTSNSQGEILPKYFCERNGASTNLKSLKYIEFDVIIYGESIGYGEYTIFDSENGTAFGLLTSSEKGIRIIPLPWNYPFLLEIMDPIPKKEKCSEYLSMIPGLYQDPLTSFFDQMGYEYSNESRREQFTKSELDRNKEREEFYRAHTDPAPQPISIDISKMKPDILDTLIEEMYQIKQSMPMKKTKNQIFLNKDTIEEKDFQSLEMRAKMPPAAILQKVPSPIQDSFLYKIMPKENVLTAEEQLLDQIQVNETIEHRIEFDDEDNDDVCLLEDFLIMLRDRDTSEIESRMKKMNKKEEMSTFIKNFLLRSKEQFHIDNLPVSTMSLLGENQ